MKSPKIIKVKRQGNIDFKMLKLESIFPWKPTAYNTMHQRKSNNFRSSYPTRMYFLRYTVGRLFVPNGKMWHALRNILLRWGSRNCTITMSLVIGQTFDIIRQHKKLDAFNWNTPKKWTSPSLQWQAILRCVKCFAYKTFKMSMVCKCNPSLTK